MNFRIATWNMDNWKRPKSLAEESWKYLESLDLDVALVQEAKTLIKDDTVVGQEIGGHRPWGSYVLSQKWKLTGISKARSKYLPLKSKYYEEGVELLNTLKGSVSIASVGLPNNFPLTVISCYGVIEDGYAQTTMFRIIADLIPLFDDVNLGKNIIFAGDINISTQLKGKTVQRRHKAVLEAIESLGLIDCLKQTKDTRKPLEDCPCSEAPDCSHVTTHRHNTGSKTQNDYIFATQSLAKKLKSCYAADEQNGFPIENDKWKLSDHCPVIAEFSL